jgi:hypothetical protein
LLTCGIKLGLADDLRKVVRNHVTGFTGLKLSQDGGYRAS